MVSSDKIDRRVVRRRQLPPVNLKDLARDPHCATIIPVSRCRLGWREQLAPPPGQEPATVKTVILSKRNVGTPMSEPKAVTKTLKEWFLASGAGPSWTIR
jgi:hypothetical protein